MGLATGWAPRWRPKFGRADRSLPESLKRFSLAGLTDFHNQPAKSTVIYPPT
jgi:hypothetical protein